MCTIPSPTPVVNTSSPAISIWASKIPPNSVGGPCRKRADSSPVSTFHSRAVPSSLQLSRSSPSKKSAATNVGSWPRNFLTGSPVFASQRRMIPSRLPDATSVPAALKEAVVCGTPVSTVHSSWLVAASRTDTVPSHVEIPTSVPVGSAEVHDTFPRRTTRPEDTSQMRELPSDPAVTTVAPSGANRASRTSSMCPRRTDTATPSVVSHTRAVPSELDVTTSAPSALNEAEPTSPSWPRRTANWRPVPGSKSLAVSSSPAVTIERPSGENDASTIGPSGPEIAHQASRRRVPHPGRSVFARGDHLTTVGRERCHVEAVGMGFEDVLETAILPRSRVVPSHRRSRSRSAFRSGRSRRRRQAARGLSNTWRRAPESAFHTIAVPS